MAKKLLQKACLTVILILGLEELAIGKNILPVCFPGTLQMCEPCTPRYEQVTICKPYKEGKKCWKSNSGVILGYTYKWHCDPFCYLVTTHDFPFFEKKCRHHDLPVTETVLFPAPQDSPQVALTACRDSQKAFCHNYSLLPVQ